MRVSISSRSMSRARKMPYSRACATACPPAGIVSLSSSSTRIFFARAGSIQTAVCGASPPPATTAGRLTVLQRCTAARRTQRSRSTRCCARSNAGQTRRGRTFSGGSTGIPRRRARVRSGMILRRSILPPSYEEAHGHARRVERASDRRIREHNKASYRLAHWPIWIFVFFIAPGPMTFTLFEHGFGRRMWAWLATVVIGTGIAGLFGRLPGVEPRPYIIRFTEHRPNPLYRRVCYTIAWSEAIAFAVLNIAGLGYAMATGLWRLRQMYEVAYFPLAGSIWLLGAIGQLPRVKRSTKGE